VSKPQFALSNVSVRFGGLDALQRFSMEVRQGTIHALIGPNGAGKTTCFNLLSKFLTPTAGSIFYKGQDITDMRPGEIARSGMVRSFQISAVFQHLTVLENVRIALQRREGDSFDFWRSQKILSKFDDEAEALLKSVGLAGLSDAIAVSLPYGQKRALEIATTLALDPEMMLLDEPTAGMASGDVERMIALIRSVAERRTVLMVEHNLSVVASLSNTVTVLAGGSILAEGDYETVSKDPRVITAYIGAGHG
jgi:branched-chain amino acid transport system ATP-binding protein